MKKFEDKEEFKTFLNKACQTIHAFNKEAGWWNDLNTGAPLERNKGELLMLIVTEISEAMEGLRKDLDDDKLPHRKMVEVEMADAVHRIFDFCGAFGYDLGGAFIEKTEYNFTRPDHQKENRLKSNGKKF